MNGFILGTGKLATLVQWNDTGSIVRLMEEPKTEKQAMRTGVCLATIASLPRVSMGSNGEDTRMYGRLSTGMVSPWEVLEYAR